MIIFSGRGEAGEEGKFFDISGPVERWNQKFKMQGLEYLIRWKDMEQSPDFDQTVLTALQSILDQILSEGSPADLINVVIDHAALDNPIYCPFSHQDKLNALKILLLIKKVQQSKKELNFDSGLRLTFTRLSMPQGGRPGQK